MYMCIVHFIHCGVFTNFENRFVTLKKTPINNKQLLVGVFNYTLDFKTFSIYPHTLNSSTVFTVSADSYGILLLIIVFLVIKLIFLINFIQN